MSAATITRALPRLQDGVDDTLRHSVPEGICRTFRVMPYARHHGQVLVAAADAEDAITEHVVADRLDAPVVLVRHPAREITEVVDEAYPRVDAEVESPEARRARMQMTRMLTDSGVVTHEQLRQAMLEYARTGDPLGDILVSHGSLDEDVLVAALSELHQVQRVGLGDFEPDYGVSRRLPEPLARRLRALPLVESEGVLLVAVARPLPTEGAAAVEDAVGQPFRQLLANRTDLDRLLQQVHGNRHAEAAVVQLRERSPHLSAHVVVTPAQKAVLVALAATLAVTSVLWPAGTAVALVVLGGAAYLGATAFRVRLVLRALATPLVPEVGDPVTALDERALPTYSILVPLRRDADRVGRLVRDLDALDYPRTRLDVLLLCDDDDLETIEAVAELELPPHYRLVVVPDGQPRTRARACNLGLRLATGAYCVVYDADDHPDADQLRRAVAAFDAAPDAVVCLRARRHLADPHRDLLAAWSATEHALDSDLVLPALGASEAPIPLVGTSQHLRTQTLRELGGWDPCNVTEDVDLAVRLHREGFRAAPLDSTTLEDADADVSDWVRRRSRWATGALQTWLVHMRSPRHLLQQTGLRGFLAFNLTMASVLVQLLNPLLWTLTTAVLLTEWWSAGDVLPAPVSWSAVLVLVVGTFAFIHLNVAATLQRGEFRLTRAALLSPGYWGLMSLGAWRGLVQLFTHPLDWETSTRGRGRV